MIDAAAIRQDGKVWTLPQPNRHHNVIRLIIEQTGNMVTGEQGFVDHEGQFLSQEEARDEALKCKQLTQPRHATKLFSEDLW